MRTLPVYNTAFKGESWKLICTLFLAIHLPHNTIMHHSPRRIPIDPIAVTFRTQSTRLSRAMSHPLDNTMLFDHQAYLRQQIEIFFAAMGANVQRTPVCGRTKRVLLDQVGIRNVVTVFTCRFQQRQLGSVYFFPSTMGFYQTAQNMLSMHIQCEKCTALPASVTGEFHRLLLKNDRSTGRRYWVETIRELGLHDTDCGIFVVRRVPLSAKIQLPTDKPSSPKR
jgi:hypothetical protein